MRRPEPRVLFLSTIDPASRDVGKKVVVGGLCDFLCERIGRDRFLFATTDDVSPGTPWNVVRLRTPSTAEKLANVLVRSLLLARSSIQESLFRSARLRRDIARLVGEFDPDIVIFDTVRLGQYLPEANGHCRTILYLDDLFSVRYERMLRAGTNGGLTHTNPLGNFARHVPGPLRGAVARHEGLVRALLALERRLVRRSEVEQSQQAHVTLLLNRDEVRELKARASRCDVRECPPLLRHAAPAERRWNGEPSFVFLGALNLPHNLAAVEAFLHEALPALLGRVPRAVLRVAGRHAPDSLRRLAAAFGEHVVLEGFVADVRGLLARSCALVAPLVFGSGTKIKVIESLAAGTPVIATPIGAEGINLVDGRHGLIVEDVRGFPAAMEKLLDPALNRQLSLACRQLYDEEYSAEAVHERYAEILGLHAPSE